MNQETANSRSVPMGITMGDASGVGPEIVLRAHADGSLGTRTIVYGDASILQAGERLLGLPHSLHIVSRSDEMVPGKLNVIDLALLRADQHRPRELDAEAGAAAREYVAHATRDALVGHIAGIVTLPMNKEATQLSYPDFVGHTEFIAALCGAPHVTMMLTNGPLAVTHVSTHCSLQDAIGRVRMDRVLTVIELTHQTLNRFIANPRVAVCGLNPHAGENGLFGQEDIVHIAPAIAAAVASGIDASGPHPADTVFYQAVHKGRYDAIVCMYHDQGHAPMKLLAFDTGVNVTVGLPIIRTSVDHGTAFDIAWTGQAFTNSLVHALDYAWRLAGT
jgi:4-phospho-D-threonate 3-dehydrogenase / 4-phospho-D-erythronate 3-dehydrogenase